MGYDARRQEGSLVSRAADGAVTFGPGKRTLTDGLAVQRRGEVAAPAGDAVHASAERGVAGGGGRLPHFDTIQKLFGRHDVSGVQAHVGGAAAQASQEIGAQAYATGDRVAFASAPDLHTAAHEAAHVVQQRGGVQLKGGVGQAGDSYERHADEVADAVVQGKSAEALLDRHAGSGGTAATPAVQRIVRIQPAQYLAGIGSTALTATAAQVDEYLTLAIFDDLTQALGFAEDTTQLEADETLLKDAHQTPQAKLAALPAIIGRINAVVGNQRNADTRYATTPGHGYKNAALPGGATWGSDDAMRAKFGPAMATSIGKQPGLGTRAAAGAGAGKLALKQLPWDEVKQMLPRPLINLLFDVRMQLEAGGGGGVIDERTALEQQNRAKSPHDGGALRSWHLDSAGVLPGNGFVASGGPGGNDNVPLSGQALHTHYAQHSQNGAGASIGAGKDRPQGFAEYTGTGSDTEHNTKVVLDYMTKRVYLTLSHYQYWALAKVGSAWRFVEGGTQDKDQAEAAIGKKVKELGASEHQIMSPWLEIVMPTAGEIDNPTVRATPPPQPVVVAPSGPPSGASSSGGKAEKSDKEKEKPSEGELEKEVEKRVTTSVGKVTPSAEDREQATQIVRRTGGKGKRQTGQQRAVTTTVTSERAVEVVREQRGSLSYATLATYSIGVLIAIILLWYAVMS